MSIPIDSAFSGADSEQESFPENRERQPNSSGAFRNPESFCAGIAPQATRYAMSIVRVWADAEEVVQEAFCRLIQSSQINTDSVDKALLFTTVRNLAIDRLRQKKRRRFEPLDVADIANSKTYSDESRIAKIEHAIGATLKDLPSQWSDALQLKINGGLSYAEIASVLDATHAQVRSWIYRARKQLEKDLGQQGLLNRGNS